MNDDLLKEALEFLKPNHPPSTKSGIINFTSFETAEYSFIYNL